MLVGGVLDDERGDGDASIPTSCDVLEGEDSALIADARKGLIREVGHVVGLVTTMPMDDIGAIFDSADIAIDCPIVSGNIYS